MQAACNSLTFAMLRGWNDMFITHEPSLSECMNSFMEMIVYSSSYYKWLKLVKASRLVLYIYSMYEIILSWDRFFWPHSLSESKKSVYHMGKTNIMRSNIKLQKSFGRANVLLILSVKKTTMSNLQSLIQRVKPCHVYIFSALFSSSSLCEMIKIIMTPWHSFLLTDLPSLQRLSRWQMSMRNTFSP